VRGGKCAAILYSLVQTAKAIGIDPKTYVRDVLERVRKESDRSKLTPRGWKEHFAAKVAAELDSFRERAIAVERERLNAAASP